MKILTKTIIVMSTIFGIIVIFSLINILFLANIGNEIASITEEDIPLSIIITEITIHQLEQAINFERALRFAEIEDWQNYEIAKEDFRYFSELADEEFIQGKEFVENAILMAKNQIDKEEFEMVDSLLKTIDKEHHEYEEKAFDVFSMIDSGNFNNARLEIPFIQELEEKLDHALEDLTFEIEQFTLTSALQAETDQQHAFFILIIGLIAISSVILFLIFFIRRALSPLGILKNSAQKISAGQLNLNFDTSGNDEIADLSKSFKQMIESIKQSKLLLEENFHEIEKQKNELEKQDKLKEEFSSMVTHELKTPLTPIRGYCEMLKDEGFGTLTKDQFHYVEKIDSSAAILQRLIGDILDVQKLAIDRMQFNKQSLDIDEFWDKLKQDSAHLMKDKGIEFVVTDYLKTSIKTDQLRLRQILDNLIRNAVDFVPSKDGRIEVGAKRENGKMIFHVKDNGVGISKDKQQNIFKKFYQADTSYTRKHGGTGVGLVICKGIVNALGGEIWFESEPGKGTTFYFSIPIFKEKITMSHHDDNEGP